jgi:hypothetical protein
MANASAVRHRGIATLGLVIPAPQRREASHRSPAMPEAIRGAENYEIECRIGAKSAAAFGGNQVRFAPVFRPLCELRRTIAQSKAS